MRSRTGREAMIRLIVDRLEAGDAPTLEATDQIRHLLVDEYQDTNPLEERLIQLLRRGCETLTVVGDDDQSIYGWRGADVQNILDFTDRNPRRGNTLCPTIFAVHR